MSNDCATLMFLTDPHIYADQQAMLKGINTMGSFQAVLAEARKKMACPDAVVLGGDLAQDEMPESYLRLRVALGDWVGQCHAIPGNHDDPAALGSHFGDSNLPIDVGGWRIILLDSHVDGQVGGTLGAEGLRHLQAQLVRSGQMPVMVVLHHHPVPVGSRWLDGIALRDADAFWQLVDAYSNESCGLWSYTPGF